MHKIVTVRQISLKYLEKRMKYRIVSKNLDLGPGNCSVKPFFPWYLCKMVVQNMVRMCEAKQYVFRKNVGFDELSM